MSNINEFKFKSPRISMYEMERHIDPKLHAIEFAKYVSTKEIKNFYNMTREEQYEIYSLYLTEYGLNY